MKAVLNSIFFLACMGSLTAACQQPRRVAINESYRKATEQELNDHADEIKAELIASRDFDDFTYAVFENQQEIRHGFYFSMVLDFEDGEAEAFPNTRESNVYRNPQAKVSLLEGTEGFARTGGTSYGHSYMIAVIHDQALLQEVESVKVTFKDASQKILPAKDKKAILYLNQQQKECCKQVDFVSASGKVLNHRADGIQVSP
ncbi:MAG: hypothetical protein AAF329_20870 [Cyanobacteria bacterium P01_A01_bin.17]